MTLELRVNDKEWLHQVSYMVDDVAEGVDLGQQMLYFLTKYNRKHGIKGVGLSAVQVGVLKRVFVIMPGYIFVNPEIIEESPDMETKEEGCLSLPGVVVPKARPTWIKAAAANIPNGVICEEQTARVFCHELAHLNGEILGD